MKTLALALFLPALAFAAPSPNFYRALNLVETSGRSGPILGDSGRALGPFSIHRSFWQDSRVPGDYQGCADYAYSVRVVSAYLKRYAPHAWDTGDWRTLCRIHNGGLTGYKKTSTIPYLRKVEAEMRKIQNENNYPINRRKNDFRRH